MKTYCLVHLNRGEIVRARHGQPILHKGPQPPPRDVLQVRDGHYWEEVEDTPTPSHRGKPIYVQGQPPRATVHRIFNPTHSSDRDYQETK